MKVSVVTINYNNVTGLKRTLESVNAQTCKDYELVIVDGASNDGSKDVIEDYAASHSNVTWVAESDKGIYNAMNKGVRMSSGEYCIFMNSGDCFYDSKVLEASMEYLDGNIYIIVGSAVIGNFLYNAPEEKELSLSFFVKESLCHQSAFIKRTLLLKIPYNETRKIAGDTEFFANALIIEDASYINIPICVSRYENAGASANIDASFKERLVAIKELLPCRMAYDVDFIYKYHNILVLKIGSFFYRDFFKKLNRIIRSVKKHKANAIDNC